MGMSEKKKTLKPPAGNYVVVYIQINTDITMTNFIFSYILYCRVQGLDLLYNRDAVYFFCFYTDIL